VLPKRYVDVRPLGRGGMGEIVRAEDTTLGRIVAVKLLDERLAEDEANRARFTREALAAARVSGSTDTVTIYDVGEWDGRPYIVMEYLPGGSVADRLEREGAQPPGRVLDWIEAAGRALDAAHAEGIVHRDVKPGNLLLDDRGGVKVADFGIASAAGLDPLTQAGTVLGTTGYLSPEQARGERATSASDLYSLGAVAYELLSGRRPFERDSAMAEATAHANERPPPVTDSNPSLPGSLDRVFATALAKDPAGRYESGAELSAALREAFREDERATRVVAAAAPPALPPAVHRKQRTRLPLVAGLLALLALGGVALASVLAARDDPEATERTVERTVTTQGETVTVTATTEAEPPPPPPPPPASSTPPPPPAPSGDPAELNDQGFQLMNEGDYKAALPLLEQAVEGARGSGSLTEAYASYNLALTRYRLGSCDGVVELLDRSEEVQGPRKEITRLRKDAERSCGDGGEG
jgi:eukaryotic-like serine/threonine-protein kinase